MKRKIINIMNSLLILSLTLSFTPVQALKVPGESGLPIQEQVDVVEPILASQEHKVGLPELDFPEMISERHGMEEEYPEREFIPPSPEDLAETSRMMQEFSCTDVTDVLKTECEALVALYNSTNGAGWRYNTNWLISSTVGNWYGVEIYDGHVSDLDLYNNRLTGIIPVQLNQLVFLQNLDLSKNQLTGAVPSEIGSLVNLWELDLTANYLTSIPSSVGNLANLSDLYLSGNQLSNIPSELGSLSNLITLELGVNELTSIPPELGHLNNLYTLSLGGNQLSIIPPELGLLSSLANLDLTSNHLTTIPSEFGNLTNLIYLNISLNALNAVPSELSNLMNLQELLLHNNQITGSIPSWLGELSLWYLDLSNNQFSGNIPPELASLTFLSELFLHNNPLTGSIPLSFVNFQMLRHFIFYDTFLCEPNTSEFLAWKATVWVWEGTGVICEPPTSPTWLMMFYMAGDNNLDEFLRISISIIRQYNLMNPNVEIAIFYDSKELDTSYRFYSSTGDIEYIPKGNLNSGDGNTLIEFINWAKQKSSAPNQALVINDHGHGLTGIAKDIREQNFFPFGFDMITASEFRSALISTGPMDIIYIASCLTGNLEFMWELRGLADYYVASESVMWLPEGFQFLQIIAPDTSSEDLAVMMAESYYEIWNKPPNPSTISVVNMVYLQEIFIRANTLAMEIRLSSPETKLNVWGILDSSVLQRFDENFPPGIDNLDRLADLFHFASLVNFFPELSPAASALLALENDFVIYNRAWSGERWDNHVYWDHSNARGVAISLPMNPISFYDGEWLDFASGADWSFVNPTAQSSIQAEGYSWGPMISDLLFINNPSGDDDEIPPDLVSPGILLNLYLPLITR